MSLAIKYGIRDNNLIVKKNVVGSICIIFSTKKKSIVISDENEVNLSTMCTMDDLNHSNLERLLGKGFIKIVVYK